MSEQIKPKALSKQEKIVCQALWGGVPVDTGWVRESKLFQARMAEFDTFTYKWKWPDLEWYNGLNGTEILQFMSDQPINLKLFYKPLYDGLTESTVNEQKMTDIF